MSDRPLRVIKLGGSLLGLPDFADRVRRWIALQPEMANVVICGGGFLIENLRKECMEGDVDEATAHLLAMQTMSVTAHLAASALDVPMVAPSLTKLSTTLTSKDAGDLVVLDTFPAVCGDEEEQQETGAAAVCDLPQSWHVTSDSIAAWVAGEANCDELILLKSALPEGDCRTWHEAAEQGYVDSHFPQVVDKPECARSVNLRDDSFPEWAPEEPAV